jgi:hypothetical protein
MEQKKASHCLPGVTNDGVLCAKLHLVDLAGSKRAKQTGVDGMRFKEGIFKAYTLETFLGMGLFGWWQVVLIFYIVIYGEFDLLFMWFRHSYQ